jgi:hypothetical protein
MKPFFRPEVTRYVSEVREVGEHEITHSIKPRRARFPLLLEMKLSAKS